MQLYDNSCETKRWSLLVEKFAEIPQWPTLHNQPGRRLQILYAEGKGAAVFDWEVRDGEAVDLSLGTHTEAIARLKLDCVSHPGSWDIGIGELHLERCRFSLCGFDVSHPSYDGDFSSCEEKCGVRAITVLWHLSICFYVSVHFGYHYNWVLVTTEFIFLPLYTPSRNNVHFLLQNRLGVCSVHISLQLNNTAGTHWQANSLVTWIWGFTQKPAWKLPTFFTYSNGRAFPVEKKECLFWRPDDSNLSFEGQGVNLDAMRGDPNS